LPLLQVTFLFWYETDSITHSISLLDNKAHAEVA